MGMDGVLGLLESKGPNKAKLAERKIPKCGLRATRLAKVLTVIFLVWCGLFSWCCDSRSSPSGCVITVRVVLISALIHDLTEGFNKSNCKLVCSDKKGGLKRVFQLFIKNNQEGKKADTMKRKQLAMLAMMLYVHEATAPRPMRQKKTKRAKIEWSRESSVLSRESQIKRYYRMAPYTFERLLLLLGAAFPANYRQQIHPTLMLQDTIRFLSGDSHHDIRRNTGVSSASFYRMLWCCCNAILSCQDTALSIDFPTAESTTAQAINDFGALSSHGVFNGAV